MTKTSPPKIVFLGMPGSGKTTYGKAFAAAFNYPFYDLDHIIEEKEGRSIPEIVARFGMSHFRQIERKHLIDFIMSTAWFVLSCGGGTPCQFNNMDIIKTNSYAVYLHTSVEELFTRLNKHGLGNRPLFAGLSPEALKAKIKAMYDQRHPFYKESQLVLENSHPSHVTPIHI